MIKGVIFDFAWTIYNPDLKALYPEALPLLKELKKNGLKLGLVSRTDDAKKRRETLKDLGMSEYFNSVDIFPKESAKEFDKVFKDLGVTPEETIVLGDRIESEITEGNKAGAITVWIRQGKYSGDEANEKIKQPDYTIFNLKELLDILEDYEG